MVAPVDFSDYLQSLVDAYKPQQDLYTLTDLEVEIRVETPASPEQPQAQKEVKVERSPVLTGLRKYGQQGHVLLVGKPGSGKSMALQRLRWELAQAALNDETQPIPVLVALRSDRSIPEAICAELRKARLRVTLEQIDEWLLNGRLFLLLDGLNEIPSQEREHQIDQFRKDNLHTLMIFTSRELGTELGIGQKLEMCGLTERQMRSFVEKYLPDYADQLLRQLQDRLRELAETPLLLKLLCEVFDPETQQIPHSKGELFQAVDRKYNTWKTGEGARTSEKFWQWNGELLRGLAFSMLQADGRPTGKWLQVGRSKAEQMLERFLQDRVTAPGEKAKDWLQDLLDHHLLQVAANPNQIEFRHQLFQEYYAAEYALLQLENLSDDQLKCNYLNLLKWTEPLAMMLSVLKDETQAVQVVQLALDVDWMLGARLAGEVKREFQEQTVGLVSNLKILKQWKLGFVKFMRKVNVPQWLKVRLWGKTRSNVAISALLHALEHSDSDVRRNAAEALGEISSESVIDGLLQAVADPDSYVRQNAAEALGKIGSDTAIPGLIQALADPYVDWIAVEALVQIGSDAAIMGLIQALTNPDSDVHQNAVEALGKIGSDATIPGLIQALADPCVHWNAAEALVQISSDAAILSLLQALTDSNSYVRQNAAEALGKIGSDTAIPGLIQALADPHVDWIAVEALGKIGSDAAIPGLLQALADPDSEVCQNAAKALGEIGSDAAIQGLLQALADSDLFVGWSAAEALGKIGSDAAIPGLLQALADPDSDVVLRQNAVKALGKIGSDTTIPGLLQALADSDLDVRENAAEALVQVGSDAAILGLLQALADSDEYVCWSAAVALGKIVYDATILSLPQALADSDENAGISMAEFGKIVSKLVIVGSPLTHADPDSDVFRRAVYALCNFKNDAPQEGRFHAHILPNLLDLISTRSGKDAFHALTAIQANCQFYNWTIHNEKLNLQTEEQMPSPGQMMYVFPNVREAKIFERVEHYHERLPGSNQ